MDGILQTFVILIGLSNSHLSCLQINIYTQAIKETVLCAAHVYIAFSHWLKYLFLEGIFNVMCYFVAKGKQIKLKS